MITVHRRLEKRWIKLDESDTAEFYIQPLSSPAMIDVRNEVSIDQETQNMLISGRGVMAACTAGLCDWRGIKDQNGDDVRFSQKDIEWLPEDYLKLLAAKIIVASTLTESERKNS